jgi:hypothetical protein
MPEAYHEQELWDEILDRVETMSKATREADLIGVEFLCSKASAGLELTLEESQRITRENRDWTRVDIYEDARGPS